MDGIDFTEKKMSNEEEKEVVVNEMSLEDISTKLIAMGVNTCLGSYESGSKELASKFFEMPLSSTANTWPFLSERARLVMIDSNFSVFSEWLNEVSSK